MTFANTEKLIFHAKSSEAGQRKAAAARIRALMESSDAARIGEGGGGSGADASSNTALRGAAVSELSLIQLRLDEHHQHEMANQERVLGHVAHRRSRLRRGKAQVPLVTENPEEM